MANPNLFVRVGYTGGHVATSTDAITWTTRTSVFGTTIINKVAWSPNLALFCAVGANGKLATSPDGVTWTLRTTGMTDGINSVVWSATCSIFLAFADTRRVLTSPDGITWTYQATSVTGVNGIGLDWSPALGLFVTTGLTSVATSADGTTWTLRATGFESRTVTWSAGLGLFVAGGAGGAVSTSPDAITWTARNNGGIGTGSYILSSAWSPSLGLFVIGSSGGYVATSPDGVTWTPRNLQITSVEALAWSPVISTFVAAGSSSYMSTSPDGVTWTRRAQSTRITSVAWSTALNLTPYAPTLLAPNGVTIDRSVAQRLSWAFGDPDFGDAQSKFDLQYRLDAGAWTPVTGVTPNNFWDAPPATLAAGSYEWQVRTYDALGLVGPYSASAFFTAADAPTAPTITAPTSGSTVSSTSTLTWSAPNQTDYQYRRVGDSAGAADTATVYFDSGDVVDAATRSRVVSSPVNARWEHQQVRVKSSGLWSPWADCRVYVSFTAPAVPTLTATPDNATASVLVSITNPTPTGSQPAVLANDVWISAPDVPAYRAATGVPVNGIWRWWTPGSGRDYTVSVVAIGDNATSTPSV